MKNDISVTNSNKNSSMESQSGKSVPPLVSVVMPVYNGERYLREAIDSALAQTYRNIEIIVVNDGSSDGTEAIAKSYGEKIRYFKKNNGGVASALNTGLREMKGSYFSWLSHDDWYYPDKIAKQIDFLCTLPDKNVILYSDYEFIDADSKVTGDMRLDHSMLEKKPEYALFRHCVNGNTLFVPRKAFDDCGFFDERLRCVQDYDMWLRMMRSYAFVHMPGVVARYRRHGMQATKIDFRTVSEGDAFWEQACENIAIDTKVKLEGTEYNFYREMVAFFETTPYAQAAEFCRKKAETILATKSEDVLSVLFLSHSSALSGAELALLEVVKSFSESGARCHVILPYRGLMEDRLKAMSVSYSLAPMRWWVLGNEEKAVSTAEEIMGQAIEIMALAEIMKPDIVYSNTSVINIGAIVAKEIGLLHIWHIHEMGAKPFDFAFMLNDRERMKYIEKHSDFVIFNSNATKSHFQNFSPFSSSEVVYNDVSITPIDEEKREKHFFKKDRSLKLAIIGSVIPGKNQQQAIVAVGLLKEEGIDAKLAIIGPMPDRRYYDSLRKIIHDEGLSGNIVFHDFSPDVRSAIRQSDIVVVCAENESFGRVTVEAMLEKKPVVGVRSGGTAELIKDNVNGFLYEPGDAVALKERIEAVMNDAQKTESVALCGYRYAVENFVNKRNSEKIIAIAHSIAKRSMEKKRTGIARVDSADEMFSMKGYVSFLSRKVNGLREMNADLKAEIRIMKASHFWRMRSSYMNFKGNAIRGVKKIVMKIK